MSLSNIWTSSLKDLWTSLIENIWIPRIFGGKKTFVHSKVQTQFINAGIKYRFRTNNCNIYNKATPTRFRFVCHKVDITFNGV